MYKVFITRYTFRVVIWSMTCKVYTQNQHLGILYKLVHIDYEDVQYMNTWYR